MYIRKLGAIAGLAAGAAFALAPLASADVTGIDPTSVLDSEISSQNSLFEFEALLAGESNDITVSTTPGVYDTIPAADVPTTAAGGAPTTLETELYGVNPIAAGISGDTGPYDEFNGALSQFDNAFNVELYSFFNGGNLDLNVGDYIENNAINHVLGTAGETPTQAFDYLYNYAIGDLGGYFQTDLSALDIATPAAATAAGDPLSSLVSGEITSANSLFESGASLTGVPTADLTLSTTTFDTIPAADLLTGGTPTTFDDFLFGLNPLANASSDPGAYDLFNGALVRFDDAVNVGVYALENQGALLPAADFATDLFGSTSSLTSELAGLTASQAITELLGNASSDLMGYFDFSALGSLF